jgi:modulator of FtsH protease HflC
MKPSFAVTGIIIVIIGIIASNALFTVDQRAQAIVMQFGDPRRVIAEPGLNFKIPILQQVLIFDKRVLDLDPPAENPILADKKRIIVDAFARYRIVDPLRFYQAARTEARFRDAFGKILNSSIRNVLGNYKLVDVLSKKRVDIMQQIQDSVAKEEKSFGVKVIDVRIVRTDLPADISKNVFDRMRSEREREANLMRAEGEEIKQKIVANADRQQTIILAEARRKANILRGQGEGEKNRILGKAFGTDPDFFAFYRSMEAYRKALADEDATLVLSPDSDFFRFFSDSTGKITK